MHAVTLVVEGDTDVPFAKKILAAAGLTAKAIVDAGGKTRLDPQLSQYNQAARHSAWVVFRDLDQDAACAPELLQALLPQREAWMCLRIPVRAIEAWAMGDPDALAKHLKVRVGSLPLEPELEADPKRTIVNLAGKSTSSTIKRDLIPPPHAKRKAGPGYESSLIEFAQEHWRLREAQKRCPSLKRCIAALIRLRKELEISGPLNT
jgi:hypothetical protein